MTASGNPTNKEALTGKFADNGRNIELLQPENQIELTNDAPASTGATNSSPFGFTTAEQADDLVATVNEMRAALISVGICKDSTANA